MLGVSPGAPITAFGLLPHDSAGALDAFVASCPVATSRPDLSGLTRPSDWIAACRAAATWPRAQAARFFARFFESVRVGNGAAFATGYYEPEIRGSLTRRPGYDVPIYGLPSDLVRAQPADAPAADTPAADPDAPLPLGRYDRNGEFVPYYDRAQIEDGALAGRGLAIAWAADPVAFFFLQIQGSGVIRTPDGRTIRIGYAGQNGRPYTSIGSIMRQRGLLGDGPGQYPATMQGIMAYLHQHPIAGDELMRLNQSWVFFRILDGPGPVGSIGVPVSAQNSVAVDPHFVPYGAPVFLSTDQPAARGLWIAQDTGGAIHGPNRFDTYWGAGPNARQIAGSMSAHGQATLFLPRGTLARLSARARAG